MRLPTGAVIMVTLAGTCNAAHAETDRDVERIVAHEIQAVLPANDAGGAAVAVRIRGRTLFFNYGFADAVMKRQVTSDALFNLASLRKVFEATLLAQAIRRGEIALDDPVARYVKELSDGHDIRRITIGQLATHTSGLLLPQDHPPWPQEHYTREDFIRVLNAWHADKDQEPGKQHIYTHAGYVLLQLALERRFMTPIRTLIETRILKPLGMSSTALPEPGADPRGELDSALQRRAVQGYDEDGNPIGKPGDIQGYYLFDGTGQMYSSAHDMAVFLAACLGELSEHHELEEALVAARRARFQISLRNEQALAWEINHNSEPPIIEKNGGLDNASSYIGMIPRRRLGVVILSNRGDQDPADVGRRILHTIGERKETARAVLGNTREGETSR
jgi:beta-lactamase class C